LDAQTERIYVWLITIALTVLQSNVYLQLTSYVVSLEVLKPQNLEEKLVWYSIIGTYGINFLGALYVWIPVLAWLLAGRLGVKLWQQTEESPPQERITIPLSIWVWVISMLFMELTVVMSHIDFDLGWTKIASSTIVWSRSWALMALFPIAGCLPSIRPRLVYRAICIVCAQSIVFALLAFLAFKASFYPAYLTPWWYLFRGDPQVYTVAIFGLPPGDGLDAEFRLNLFTPFANTLGIVGAVFFFLAIQESDKRWKWAGAIGAAIMVIFSFSRMTTLCLVIVPALTWLLTNFTWHMRLIGGLASFFLGLFGTLALDSARTFYEATFVNFRQGSEKVRSKLAEIALYKWETEAQTWGHGFVTERGPETTEGIPIGTHNQWPDLLYLRGTIGFFAFLVPLLWTFADLLIKAQKSQTAKVGLTIVVLLVVCTSGANVEAATYLYWPGLLILGMAFQAKE